jgi:hypothetical protein
MLLHDSSGAQGEWLDLVCWCAEGTNRTEFPCGFSSTAAVCRTCRTLTLMVLPHLLAIVQLLRQVSSTSPSAQLHRARILPWDYTAPPPRICPGNPPHSCTGDWAAPPPVTAPDRAPSPFPRSPSRHSAPGTRPRPLPTSARDRAPGGHIPAPAWGPGPHPVSPVTFRNAGWLT